MKKSNPRRRRSISPCPTESVDQRIRYYESDLRDYEDCSPDDGDRPSLPTRPQFKFEELAAVAQECIRTLDAHPYYALGKALGFSDQETATLFRPLMDKVTMLRIAATDVDKEILNLRSVMIEREMGELGKPR